LHGYIHDTLNRQMLGFKDTLALTAALLAYLTLCAAPPFLWSRRSYYHPVWRGIESFVCYTAVALVLGAVFAGFDGGNWSAWSGIVAGGDAWARVGSVVVLFLVFILASWWGDKAAVGRRRRIRSRKRRKSKVTPS
jgi:hypothetical protein